MRGKKMRKQSLEQKVMATLMGINMLNTMTPWATMVLDNEQPQRNTVYGGGDKG